MKKAIEKALSWPVLAHLLAANDRYNKRLGPQFAAAITYFSVLSLVPILMFAFATLGWTVMVLRPELMDDITALIQGYVSDAASGESLADAVEFAFSSWDSVGLAAILAAAYSGSNWVGNLKRAVRVMWSRKFSDAAEKGNFFVELGQNLATFVGLLVCIATGMGVAQAGSSLSQVILDFFGWSHIPGIRFFWTALSLVLVFVASWLLVAFLFLVLPNQRVSRSAWLRGSLFGAFAIAVLQAGAGQVFALFDGNRAVDIFGSVIALMLVLNLLATLILMTAAWVGTEDTWAEQATRELSPLEVDDEPAAGAPARWAGTRPVAQLRDASGVELPPVTKDTYVRQDIATRAVKTGWITGYGIGGLTGAGLGALAVVLRSWRRRR